MRASTLSLAGATTSHLTISHYNPCLSPEGAVARYTDQIQRGTETHLTRLLRAKAYVQLHNYASACADLESWIQKTGYTPPDTSGDVAADSLTEALFYRGVCRARLSQVKDAVGDFTEVLQREPGHRRAQYERAACHARLDDYVNAIADYEAALQMDEVGGKKKKLHRYRECRRCSEQQQPGQTRSESLRPRLVPLPLGSFAIRSPSPVISPLLQQMSTLGSESAQLVNGLLALEQTTPRSPVASRGSEASSGRRASVEEASNSAVATVSLLKYTTPAAATGSTSLSEALGRRYSQGHSHHKHYYLKGDSSSTESSPDDSVMSVDKAVKVVNTARKHEIGASYGPHCEDSESGQDTLTAMDPTCILSSNSTEYDERLPDDEVGAETWQRHPQREASHTAASTATAGPPLLDEHYFYQRGLQHRQSGELEAAVAMYTKALEISPTHFKALFNRAFCEDKLKNYARAIDDYTAALELDPRNPFTYYNLGISYDHTGSHARAVQAFTRAIELDDHHPDFFHNRGFMQRKQGAYTAAIADYTAAIFLDPNHFKSHYNRAYCFAKLGYYDEAVADYTAALKIDSDNSNVYHNRGAALAKLGKLRAAVEDFNRALKRDPKLAFSLNARGLVYDQLQQYDRAVADFTEAIRLDKRNPTWLHNRGHTYRNMGELELAIADYSAAIKMAPHGHTTYSSRAYALRKLGRYEAAIEDYTKALNEQPGVRTKVLNSRAYCFARLNLFEYAIRDYSEVLATDPVDAHALYNRGISFEMCGKYSAAIDDFTRAIRRAPEAPSTANAYYSRGTSRLQLHQVPQAVGDLKQALRLDLMACGLHGEALHSFQSEHPAWRLLQDLGTL
ncbi:conserved hypothetical protein [Leishmania braziliensis MHOM/BR/75/M2904]|uniref:Uncharacterized protein n=2 Tax=Leishmania braziliensis TaxID=5660 RepID=A4HIN3_LEIBR|nr:conserved hypothetical protein [Leishmania braziliensis MHOM/BR/75/M2904]CAJ2477375.1 unnamed protein product [Leishmania braziliensis]CAM40447.1 conserved hypothetical protein [Leishmania braziliensis MHOM/BR/75/M2904]SYZ68121.1 Tetratricopeptide_repeat/TPR_repeat [Leishmania braziliensis MHOM/BR/75/M2904]